MHKQKHPVKSVRLECNKPGAKFTNDLKIYLTIIFKLMTMS